MARGADPALGSSMGLLTTLTAASAGKTKAGLDHMGVLRLLLDDGRVPVDARDTEGKTALYWACFQGHTDRARLLLVEGGADHTIADNDGLTPMAVAHNKRRQGCIRLLQVRGQPATTMNPLD